jgi:flagellar basal-body rod protein FlgB
MALKLSFNSQNEKDVMSGSNIDLLEKFIDYCSLKNKTISRNIANIGTENYRREEVDFGDVLDESINNQLKTDNPKHIQITQSTELGTGLEIVNDGKTEGTGDVNNVNIEKEMAELAKNTMDYRFAARKIGNYYRDIQSAIRGGSSQ